MKKYFRCIVCGDLHFGNSFPVKCPTCMQDNVYVEIEEKEFNLVSFQSLESQSNYDDKWDFETEKTKFEELCSKNGQFILNPDNAHADMILKGLIETQKSKGLKFCPCRMGEDDKFETKMGLICPCNFFQHDVYKEKKRDTKQCWCGLFVKN